MSIIMRYTTNENGAIVITGNTLGLSERRGTRLPGTDNAINQFITTNGTLPVPTGWSGVVNTANNENVTFDWNMNASSAFLVMPDHSEVLYAELIWGGMAISQSSQGPDVSVEAFIDNAVSFITPVFSTTVNPDSATKQVAVVTGYGTFYIRSQNVTSLIQAGGKGKYTVGGVPSAVNIMERSTLNHAGWSLLVVYKNADLPPRNMTVYVGEELINDNSTTNVTVTGFLTPPSGAVSARILVSAQEGDADLTGDRMLFGPNAASLVPLSGPNNPADNFFASQINIGDPNNTDVGRIDTSGTFGSRNANAATGTLINAGRQGWDITNVNGSDSMTNSQNSALIRMNSEGDVYVLNGLGVQIDTIKITSQKSADKAQAGIGENIHYTVTLKNEGGVAVNHVTFTDPAPSGTSIVANSLQVSKTYTGNLTDGIVVAIQPKETVTIQWDVLIGQSIPNPNPITNSGVISITGLAPQRTNAVTTYVPNADLSISKATLPNVDTPAVPGEELMYSITVTNLGPDTAQMVKITDAVSSYLLNPMYSVNGTQGPFQAWSGSFEIPSLNKGSSQTIILKGIVSQLAAEVQSFSNTATVSAKTPDPVTNNNTVTITTPVKPSADLSIQKTAVPNPVVAGRLLVYQLEVKNAGPSNAASVTVSDSLPLEGGEYSVNNGVSWTAWPADNLISVGNMVKNESKVIFIRGIVPSSETTSFENTATVASQTPDPNEDNNTSTFVSEISILADVGVAKTAELDGTTLTYTVLVYNAGPSDAKGVSLTDEPPAEGFTNPEYSIDDGANWNAWTAPFELNIGDLTDGAERKVLFRGTADLAETIVNTAHVTAATPDPNLSNNTATVTNEATKATLSVEKTADKNPVNAGEELVYTIVITNTSQIDVNAYSVKVKDAIPVELQNPEYIIGTNTNWIPWTGTLNIGTIAQNDSVTIKIRGTVFADAMGELVNTVMVTAENVDGSVEDTVITAIVNEADVYVLKTGNPEPVTAGQTILYTIKVGNDGPSVAKDVVLTDPSVSLLNASYSTDSGVSWQPWLEPYQIQVGDLEAKNEKTYLIRGTIDPAATGTLRNVATVTTTTWDRNPDNNKAVYTSIIMTSADLSVTKSIIEEPIIAGEEVIYAIEITNKGPSDAQYVTMEDTIPAGILEPRYSYSLAGPWTDWDGILFLDKFAAKDTKTIYIEGTASTGLVGEVTNEAAIKSAVTFDPNLNNNKDSITTLVKTSADLAIQKAVVIDEVVAGEKIVYRLFITNLGPSDAIHVVVKDILPSNIGDSVYSIDGGTTWKSWNGSVEFPYLEALAVQEILISGELASFTTANMINEATVQSDTKDPDPNNNKEEVTSVVTTKADVAVNKISSPRPAVIGDMLVYSIAVANYGPSDAVNLVLEDVIPSEISNPEYSADGGATWDPWLGSVSISKAPSGFLRTILIRGTVEGTPGETITNKAKVSSDITDPKPENNVSTDSNVVADSADLSVIKTADKQSVQIGDMVTFTITVTNQGPSNAENVELIDSIPNTLSNVKVSYDDGSTWTDWIGNYRIGTLEEGASERILIRGTVVQNASKVINTAQVTTSTSDPDLTNNTSTALVCIKTESSKAVLILTKSLESNPVCVCGPITYVINVRNAGTVEAFNVKLTDWIRGVRNVRVSLDNGVNWKPWKGMMYLGTMSEGENVTILLRGTVCNTRKDTLKNAAHISTSSAVSENSVLSASVTAKISCCR